MFAPRKYNCCDVALFSIKNMSRVTGGANSKNICFGRTAKFIREPEDIAGNREPKLFGKLQIILEYYIIYLGLASKFV